MPGVIEFHEVVHLLIVNGLILHWTFVARLTNAAQVAEASRAGECVMLGGSAPQVPPCFADSAARRHPTHPV